MQALILAVGKGTRLRPLTVFTPKPIVPVMNRPFLLYQIDGLKKAGITDIILSLSYQPGKIEQLLGDGSDFGVNLSYVTESTPLGTGGAYKFAAGSIDRTTVVLNGDILTDVDIASIVKCHVDKKAEATITLKPVDDPSAYGLVELDAENRVKRFLEKPKTEEIASLAINTINAGIYVLEPSVLDIIPASENRSFEYHVFPDLLEKGRNFCGYVMEQDYWRDLGTPQSYLAAHMDFLDGRIKGFEVDTSKSSEIATAANIDSRSLLDENCTVKPNATIINSVIGPGVHIEEKAHIEDSVLWGHSRVSTSAEIKSAILARGCHIGRSVTVAPGAVLGDKGSIPDYSKI
jgi:NDP-sugar pyrophosphorylase family protein